MSATLGDESEVRPGDSAAMAETLEPAVVDQEALTTLEQPSYEPSIPPIPPMEATPEQQSPVEITDAPNTGEAPPPIPAASANVFTDNVRAGGTGPARKREGTTGGHRPTVHQLAANTVLNGRYEIVRRIGGGGMGAVYLAKDRNLGDAPRAVKEMVESHLDPSQHEKAIGDFKRESLLLTSL